MLLLLNFWFSIIFLFLNHPMTMGMILLFQTILISMITGFLHLNFWFSYILFLIMVGGMLVLFIYMTSIASNEMFNYSNKIMLSMSFILLLSFIIFLFMDKFFSYQSLIYLENILNLQLFNSLLKYFSYPSILIMFLMIIYLFITLIAIVKITKIESGPLRQMF